MDKLTEQEQMRRWMQRANRTLFWFRFWFPRGEWFHQGEPELLDNGGFDYSYIIVRLWGSERKSGERLWNAWAKRELNEPCFLPVSCLRVGRLMKKVRDGKDINLPLA